MGRKKHEPFFKIINWISSKWKAVTISKTLLRKWEGRPEWGMFTKHTSHRGLESRRYKGFLELNKSKTISHLEMNLEKTWADTVQKKKIRSINKWMKSCWTPQAIWEIKTKTHNETALFTIRMTNIKMADDTKRWWRCGATGTLIRGWWEFLIVQPFGKLFGSFS